MDISCLALPAFPAWQPFITKECTPPASLLALIPCGKLCQGNLNFAIPFKSIPCYCF